MQKPPFHQALRLQATRQWRGATAFLATLGQRLGEKKDMPNPPIPHDIIPDAPAGVAPDRPSAALYLAVWRAKRRIEQGGDPERTVFMVERYLDEALETMDDVGVTFRDYLGHPYEPGLRAVLPVHFEAREGVTEPIVGETIAPAIFMGDQLVEKSRVVVHAPVAKPSEPAVPTSKEADTAKAADKPAAKEQPAKTAKDKKPAALKKKAAPKAKAVPKKMDGPKKRTVKSKAPTKAQKPRAAKR